MVGDEVTLGMGSERSMLNFDYDYHMQMDGSKAGFKGFPYLLNSLFKEHNKTQLIQTMNFGNNNFTLLPVHGKTYKDTCEYQQLLSSEPDVIFAMLGGQESLDKTHFTPENFTAAYSAFIKEMRALPSKPLIFIISPSYSAESLASKKNP
jgi:hypothetical protein